MHASIVFVSIIIISFYGRAGPVGVAHAQPVE